MSGGPADKRCRASALALFVAAALALAGCSELPNGEPGPFALERFFAGTSFSRGIVRTFGFWTEDFTATFAGVAEGPHLKLDERFDFPGGKRLQRWDLTRVSPGRYLGTVRTEGDDGKLRAAVPVEGRLTPEGAVLDYDGYAPGGGSLLLHFRHVMTARGDGTVANHVTISKFGLPIATSDVVFAKTKAALGVD